MSADRLTGTGVPLAGSTLTVTYTVAANALYAPTSSGTLAWNVARVDGIADCPSGSIRIESLRASEERTGKFSFSAPAAGKLKLKLTFTRDDGPLVGELKQPSCCEEQDLNVATRFVASLESIHIHDTLSRLKDTDNALVEASFSGNNPRSNGKYIGALAGGDHMTLMPVGPFECVPGDTQGDLWVKIFILNQGYAGSDAEQFARFKSSVDGAVASGFGIADYRSGVSEWLTRNLLMPDCDGPVFIEAKAYSTDLLNKLTFESGSYIETIESVFPRKGACNANGSRYKGRLAFFRDATIYRVKVTTGDVEDAGTYSHVYIRLKGERGETREVHLDDYKENWHRGVTEEFLIASPELGNLRSVVVRHDNKNDDRSWFLDRITVEDTVSHNSWVFPAGVWFADDRGDKKIERELTSH